MGNKVGQRTKSTMELVLSLAKDLGTKLEISDQNRFVREVGETKYRSWITMYRRLNRRKRLSDY